jgi:hypothetical protein
MTRWRHILCALAAASAPLVPSAAASAQVRPAGVDLCSSLPLGEGSIIESTRFWQGAAGYVSGCSAKYDLDAISVDLSLFDSAASASAAIATLGTDGDPYVSRASLGEVGYEYNNPAAGGYVLFWARNCFVGYVVTADPGKAARAMELAKSSDLAMSQLGVCGSCDAAVQPPRNPPHKIQITELKAEEPFRDAQIVLANGCEIDATVGMWLEESDRVRTGYKTTMVLNFDGKATVVVDEVSEFKIGLFRLGDVAQMELWLKMGGVTAQVHKKEFRPTRFTVKDPTHTASVRGTVFRVTYDAAAGVSTIAVATGEVDVTPLNTALAAVVVSAGQQVTVTQTEVGAVSAFTPDEVMNGLVAQDVTGSTVPTMTTATTGTAAPATSGVAATSAPAEPSSSTTSSSSSSSTTLGLVLIAAGAVGLVAIIVIPRRRNQR